MHVCTCGGVYVSGLALLVGFARRHQGEPELPKPKRRISRRTSNRLPFYGAFRCWLSDSTSICFRVLVSPVGFEGNRFHYLESP